MAHYPSIRIEGGLLGPDTLDQLRAGALPGQRAADFAAPAAAQRPREEERPARLAAARAGRVREMGPAYGARERGARKLTDEVARAFADARSLWDIFQRRRDRIAPGEVATSLTRDAWVVPFLGLLDYELAYNRRAYDLDGLTFAIWRSPSCGPSGSAPAHSGRSCCTKQRKGAPGFCADSSKSRPRSPAWPAPPWRAATSVPMGAI